MALDFFARIDFPNEKIFPVLLSKDGCKDTEVNFEEVLKVL